MPPLLALVLAVQLSDSPVTIVPPPDCTIAVATRTTFEEIHGDWSAWRERCVAVRGIWAGEALWRGEAVSRDRGAVADPAARPDRIGLLTSEEVERRSSRPGSYLAVGRLVDCGAFGGGRDGLGGYCLNRTGPVLLVATMYRRHWPTMRTLW